MSNAMDAMDRVADMGSRGRTTDHPNAAADIPRVLQCLIEEHRYLAALIGVLASKAASLEPLRIGDYYLLRDIAGYLHDYPDQVHHPTEDVLFAKLERRRPSMKEAVRKMRLDHETVRTEIEALQGLLDRAIGKRGKQLEDPVRDTCLSFASHQQMHMEFEDKVLFTAAIEALTPSDWQQIERRLAVREDPLFGRNVGRQHRTLYEYLIRPDQETSRRPGISHIRMLECMILASGVIVNGADAFTARLREWAERLHEETRSDLKQSIQGCDPVAAAVLPLRHSVFLASSTLQCSLDLLEIWMRTARDAFAIQVADPMQLDDPRDS